MPARTFLLGFVNKIMSADPAIKIHLPKPGNSKFNINDFAIKYAAHKMHIQPASLNAFKEDPKLIYSFADIFASKIDFNTEIRFGDTFELVFEKYYKNNQFVGYGKILVARYNSKEVGSLEGFYFDQGGEKSAYFDHRGNELGESFIRSPLPMARVSSGFSYNRRHPVLNIVRPHLGVDLAAPMGTPIMATSDGRVRFAGWKGGYGSGTSWTGRQRSS